MSQDLARVHPDYLERGPYEVSEGIHPGHGQTETNLTLGRFEIVGDQYGGDKSNRWHICNELENCQHSP